jgi:leucyl aminopeptidase
MEFKIKSGDLARQKTPCLILGVFEKRKLSGPAEAIDKASLGHIAEVLSKGDMEGDKGRTLMLYGVPGVDAERILLVGCGKRKELTRAAYNQAMAAAVTLLNQTRTGEALCALPELAPEGMDPYQAVRDLVTTAAEQTYRYTSTKSEKRPIKPSSACTCGYRKSTTWTPRSAPCARGPPSPRG